MKKRHMLTRRISMILLCTLFLSLLLPALADVDTADTIHISSREDLEKLAQNCRLDSYSQGITVILEKSIDLGEEPMAPIPIFRGTFEGQGNTIHGFVCGEDGSNQGLFRYIGEDGVVRDLTLYGTVTPENSRSEVGGICGTNYGIIRDCFFYGTVTGLLNIGGVCGTNYGKIVRCEASGEVTGQRLTGGICGYNNGTVYECTNNADVNVVVQDDYLDVSDLSLSELNILNLVSLDNSTTVTDTGGVVGYSDRIIINCTNAGTVGYQHYGYNVGGIAGRQCGYLYGCTNTGTVLGRSDVGGIVGQSEPYMNLKERKTLAEEIQAFSDTNNQAMQDLYENSQFTDSTYQETRESTKEATSNSNKTVSEYGYWDLLEDTIYDKYGLDTDFDENNEEDAHSSLTQLDRQNMVHDIVDEALTSAEDIVGDPDAGEMEDLLDDYRSADGNVDDILDATRDLAEDKGADVDGMESDLDEALGDVIGIAEDKVGEDVVEDALSGDPSDETMNEIASSAAEVLIETGFEKADEISELRTERLEETEIKNAVLAANVAETNESINVMTENLGVLTDALSEMFMELSEDMMEVNEHLTEVLNMVANALSGNLTTDILEDISELDSENTTDGKVDECENRGEVSGDENVAGICGAMGIESEYDLEGVVTDTLASDGIFTNTYEASCVVRDCRNFGKITGKKNNTGGIVGQQDMGLVTGNENYGSIESEADYVGGVVGISYSTIEDCYAMCDVNGKEYVGGIAGSGEVIKDCISLVAIPESVTAFAGAIAGYADMTAERDVEANTGISYSAISAKIKNITSVVDGTSIAGVKATEQDGETTLSVDVITEKNVVGNYFVSDTLGGVNGISYGSMAEPVSYETVMSYKELPEEMQNWKITFRADGKTVKEVEFTYGGSISKDDIPEVPEKEGYTGKWPSFQTTNLTQSTIVDAEYVENISSLATEDTREGSNLSLLLVEGDFSLEDTVTVLPMDASAIDSFLTEETDTGEVWQVVLTGQDTDDGPYVIHYLAPSGESGTTAVYVMDTDGSWKRVTATREGSYILFTAEGSTVTFAAITHAVTHDYSNLAVICGSAMLLLAVLIFIGTLRRRKKNLTKHPAVSAE